MNRHALETLGKNAKAFARCYVALVEALVAEGVPEATARQEARASAALAVLVEREVLERQAGGEACPLCGH